MSNLIYSPPGVYVAEDALPVPNLGTTVALPPSRLAIVGPAVGYQTTTVAIQLNATTAVTLSNLGVISGSIAVANLSGTAFTVTTDYTVVQSGSPAAEAVTTIARVNGGAITDGQIVYVTYNYADSTYFQPFTSSDFDTIQERFGAALNATTGAINSPLTLAAKIAMEQGLREVVLLPTSGSTTSQVTRTQLSTAYGLLDARDDVGIVVPLTVGISGTDASPGDTTNVASDLKLHVENAATNGNYRIGILGLDKSASRNHGTIATGANSRRVVVAYPNVLNWYNGYLGKTVEIDGYYHAVALAAMLASRDPQEPLTRKAVRSFSSIPARVLSTMTTSAKNTLSGAGVAVTEQTSDNRLLVRHGVSTATSSVFVREVSITRAKDAMIRMIFRSLDQSGLIGSATNDETPVRLRSIVDGVLTTAVDASMIVAYSNLKVRVSATDPTAMEVKFAYRPSYPLNFVNVSFSINTVTGNTQEV